MKKIFRNLSLLFVVAVFGGALFFLLPEFLEKEETITSQGVIDQVRNVAELNTVEMYFSEIINYQDAISIRKLKLPFTEKSFIFTVKARVKAGIDLTKAAPSDVVFREDSLTIRLPQPAITSKEILDYQAYSEKNGLFNEVTNEDTFQALETFTNDLEQQAKDNGILDRARENAEKSLMQWFAAMGFKTVRIQWK